MSKSETATDIDLGDGARASSLERKYRIRGIVETNEFDATTSRFADTPSKSLLAPDARAFLDRLVRLMEATAVLEIGTYFAGATEVMARALSESTQGQIITIDGMDARAPLVKEIIAG